MGHQLWGDAMWVRRCGCNLLRLHTPHMYTDMRPQLGLGKLIYR